MFPITEDDLVRAFSQMEPPVVRAIWENCQGDSARCLQACCEMTETPQADAIASLLAVRQSKRAPGPVKRTHSLKVSRTDWSAEPVSAPLSDPNRRCALTRADSDRSE
eukprot:RCo012624